MRIYRLKELTELLGISRATIYSWMKQGTFPQSVTLGANSVGWKESDIQQWIDTRTSQALQ
ncbi:AlpA family transcriptional regulator [Vibrio parahaemolyticus]|uniref:helix-turn-helix transcriptional regulator n=1 Tax=Vibrio parahaemolyticus TaxID=670 RepID=UPI00255436BC|nr:AlpA family transcriptional regulator [Vibrio parahaemolyticus]MDK9415960.1 AlpA family transcriptional regulator [Vibrio parahaemolyticus]MDK9502016.1 AlpA family transcriptional regulator [Vibrio parahaemolyticus]